MNSLDFSQEWLIIFVPGANLEEPTDIINVIPNSHKLTDIFITSGICDVRNRNPPILKCLTALDRLKVRKHFVAISFDQNKLSPNESKTLKWINSIAETDVSTYVIAPLKRVTVADDGIHYDLIAVKTIGLNIRKHLQSFLSIGPLTQESRT